MAEFQKVKSEWKRMCGMLGRIGCFECPLGDVEKRPCSRWVKYHPEEAERIIMQWATEHPIKTNGIKFREVFGQPYEHLFEANGFIKQWLSQEYKGGQDNGTD